MSWRKHRKEVKSAAKQLSTAISNATSYGVNHNRKRLDKRVKKHPYRAAGVFGTLTLAVGLAFGAALNHAYNERFGQAQQQRQATAQALLHADSLRLHSADLQARNEELVVRYEVVRQAAERTAARWRADQRLLQAQEETLGLQPSTQRQTPPTPETRAPAQAQSTRPEAPTTQTPRRADVLERRITSFSATHQVRRNEHYWSIVQTARETLGLPQSVETLWRQTLRENDCLLPEELPASHAYTLQRAKNNQGPATYLRPLTIDGKRNCNLVRPGELVSLEGLRALAVQESQKEREYALKPQERDDKPTGYAAAPTITPPPPDQDDHDPRKSKQDDPPQKEPEALASGPDHLNNEPPKVLDKYRSYKVLYNRKVVLRAKTPQSAYAPAA
jgi:hypothetical protein